MSKQPLTKTFGLLIAVDFTRGLASSNPGVLDILEQASRMGKVKRPYRGSAQAEY
jgi:hypothetical protein